MCGFDFRQKIGESLGKSLRIFFVIFFSSKNTCKKNVGISTLKKKNGIWRSHLGVFICILIEVAMLYPKKIEYHLPGFA